MRIKGEKNISRLFTGGKYFLGTTMKATVVKVKKQQYPIQFGISIPKKLIHKATDRNLLKRRVRECIRKEKIFFFEDLKNCDYTLQVFFIWKVKKIMPYEEILSEIKFLLEKIYSQKDELPKVDL